MLTVFRQVAKVVVVFSSTSSGAPVPMGQRRAIVTQSGVVVVVRKRDNKTFANDGPRISSTV